MITLHADHAFHIGRSHLAGGTPCQDYALSGCIGPSAYAVVADGCSSGARTDLGARLVCLALEQAARRHWGNEGKTTLSLPHAAYLQHLLLDGQMALGLSPADLLATSGSIIANPDQGAEMKLLGDGVLARLGTDGTLMMRRVEWANNMPYYPAYSISLQGDFIARQEAAAPGNALTWHTCYGPLAGPWEELETKAAPAAEGVNGFIWQLSPEELATTELLAIFTDGVTQVKDYTWQQATAALMALKSKQGVFIKRRLGKFLEEAQTLPEAEIRSIANLLPAPVGKKADELVNWAIRFSRQVIKQERARGPVDDIACAAVRVEAAEHPPTP